MGIKKTIGGDRLGSGNRMKQEMHNFFRSNHNLSKTWKSTMAPGVLYPCYCNVGLPGDTFDFNIGAFMRTLPTQGPLFGSFKMQIDLFKCPIRLYQAILHNNATEIGLKMDQVKLPILQIGTSIDANDYKNITEQISSSALIKYLGFSGIGLTNTKPSTTTYCRRNINAVPVLAYYDIFKNYYANKQEEDAYVITANEEETKTRIDTVAIQYIGIKKNFESTPISIPTRYMVTIRGNNLSLDTIYVTDTEVAAPIPQKLTWFNENNKIRIQENNKETIRFYFNMSGTYVFHADGSVLNGNMTLEPFKLSNIDDMRYEILTNHNMGSPFEINRVDKLPYSTLWKEDAQDRTYNKFAMNGLVVKTYQSDLFNNWLDTEWIDGPNGIAELSKVSTASGGFTMDALLMAEKVYNLLNRIALSGGTYQDWLQAVWTTKSFGAIEKPMYCGGMSSEVVFEEVVSTAATQEDALGSLGGRGTLQTRKGGDVIIKIEDEPCFIMGIISLTPRVDYTQGNKWYMTQLESLDDLHKPSLDQIGFQDLMVEQMAWWAAKNESPNVPAFWASPSAGKQPAWLNYMTDVDEAFGEFASEEGYNYMVLARNYTKGQGNGEVQDVTTYIDPRKFNYAFAYNDLTAQNFWGFVKFDIKARRMMSARQIPNL